MAEIVLDVEVRERTGTGGARATRNEGKVPGVLYGGDKGPVPIAVNLNAFRKALYTGRLNGHLVTVRDGKDTQKAITKSIDFHPVTDVPVHFDLYRVSEDQTVRIEVPVHFRNNEASPGLKKGGALTIALHAVEIQVPAGHIPEDIVVDLTGFEIGQSVHVGDLKLPGDAVAVQDAEVVVASITGAVTAEEDEAPATEGETEA